MDDEAWKRVYRVREILDEFHAGMTPVELTAAGCDVEAVCGTGVGFMDREISASAERELLKHSLPFTEAVKERRVRKPRAKKLAVEPTNVGRRRRPTRMYK